MGQLWAALSFSDISIICSFFGNYLRSRIRQARMASRRTASKRPEAQIATKHSLMQRSLLPASRLLANLDQKYMAAPEENIPQKMRDAVVVCGFWGNGVGGFSDKIVVPPFVWMEYDMRESRHLYAQVGSSPLLFGTTMEVGGSVR